ncbi:MAG: hypothetical protein ABL953_04405 [Ilumatobacteraceae bacterium]
MAAPRFSPSPVVDTSRRYESPPFVPDAWVPDRPAEVVGFQPSGDRLGYQGPDQGYALKLAKGFTDRLQLQPGEKAHDAIAGCLGVALRRASIFGRAPVVHDLTIAFTIWGFLGRRHAEELLEMRRSLFTGIGHGNHYTEIRAIADMVPESTLRMSPQQIDLVYPAQWRPLLGLELGVG